MPPTYALSLKQPWVALVAHGHKSVEVRAWPTARRGRILIHAARVSDPRPEAWALVPPGLNEAAEQIVRKSVFSPPTKDGVRVKAWTTVPVDFKL